MSPSSAPSPGPVTRCDVRHTSVRPRARGTFTLRARQCSGGGRRAVAADHTMRWKGRRDAFHLPLSPPPRCRAALSLRRSSLKRGREGGRGREVCSIGAVRERLPIRLRLPRFVLHSIRSVRRTLLAAARNRNRQSESERKSPADERAQALCSGKSTQQASSKYCR